MSYERDEGSPLDPHLRSDSLEIMPSSSCPSSLARTTSSVFGSSTALSSDDTRHFNSVSSVLGSSSYLSSSDVEEARLILLRVQKLEETNDIIVSALREQGEELAKQKELLEQLTKRGFEADDEDDERQPVPSKKIKMTLAGRPLTGLPTKQLTEEQTKTRKELLAYLDNELKSCAGLKKNVRFLPAGAKPGEMKGKIVPDFKKEVGDEINKRLINQAALLVYKHQTDPSNRKLTFPDVRFTASDVDELAKEAFRRWKRQHEKSQDPDKKKKHEAMSKKAVRKQRQRQKKMDRAKAASVIKKEADIDATPLCLTDWMSDYVSDRADIVNEKKKEEYNNSKRRAAGYSSTANNVPIWETIKPAFRSDEADEVYEKLDEVFAEMHRTSRNKKISVKRMSLGGMRYDLPTIAPYPFMVDRVWKRTFVDEKGLTEVFKTLPVDPVGFGSRRKPSSSITTIDAEKIVKAAEEREAARAVLEERAESANADDDDGDDDYDEDGQEISED